MAGGIRHYQNQAFFKERADGPTLYHADNLATACGMCNLMKGARRIKGYVEACRHIASHRAGFDYGRYPGRFRNNTSKRSRSIPAHFGLSA